MASFICFFIGCVLMFFAANVTHFFFEKERAMSGAAKLVAILWMTIFASAAGYFFLSGFQKAQAAVPLVAEHYQALLTRTAHAEGGLSAPVSTFAAQIQQESGWNPHAQSGVGAKGMAQFMPGTADFVERLNTHLAGADVYNPGWALRALVVYDLWLLARVQGGSLCDRWAMTLAAYNGGLGWVYRDQALAASRGFNKLVWWGAVATVNAGRSKASFRQNRDYPHRILIVYEPQYVAAGWGAGVCHEGGA